MAIAYATVPELETYLGRAVPAGAARLLERASATVAFNIRAFVPTDVLGQPTQHRATIRDAVCAQVEYWLITSERVDITQWAGSEKEGEEHPLAPRADRFLSNAGLRNPTVSA